MRSQEAAVTPRLYTPLEVYLGTKNLSKELAYARNLKSAQFIIQIALTMKLLDAVVTPRLYTPFDLCLGEKKKSYTQNQL
jgi:hypothetical protein